MATINKSLFERVGGKPILERVHAILYSKVYSHPWLKLYFTDKPQEVLENQQTDFMMKLMGGPNQYAGKTPKFAHQHILITEELFDLRHQLLAESLTQAKIPENLASEWLTADATFKRALVKRNKEECEVAYANQEILDFIPPNNQKLA